MSAIASFALTAFLIELTPGPNMAWLALVSATEGRKPGYAAVAGGALGLAAVGLLAGLGLAALIASYPPAYQALRWGGVAYLLYLAWDSWREAGAAESGPPAGAPLLLWFRRGLITNLLNPKAAVFYIAVLPEFLPAQATTPDVLTLSIIYVAVATAIHALIVTAAGSAHALLADPRREQIARRGLSLALAGVAVWLLWKT